MSLFLHRETIQPIAESVAYAWAAEQSAERAFVGPCEIGFTSERAVVTVAMGGPARERVTQLLIDLLERKVIATRPVTPMSLWKGDPITPTLLAWTERCWPDVERIAAKKGVRVPACTAMAIRGRWWWLGPATLWLCVEDISRLWQTKRHAELRYTPSGRLLSDESGLWVGMKGPRR
jgi:hypothetical protein